MDQKCLPSWRNPARYPTSPDADAFVHASHLMGGVHQRGGRRAAHRAAHRGAVGPERSGRSILKLTALCRCAGPQEAAFCLSVCVLRAMRHRSIARARFAGVEGLADVIRSTVVGQHPPVGDIRETKHPPPRTSGHETREHGPGLAHTFISQDVAHTEVVVLPSSPEAS